MGTQVDLTEYLGLQVVASLDQDGRTPLTRDQLADGDLLLVRGEPEIVGQLASDMRLAVRDPQAVGPVADVLLSRHSGLAEVVIPERSELIGRPMFPGMTTEDGGLMLLAVTRGSVQLRGQDVELRAGHHLLLQGSWAALDRYLSDPKDWSDGAPVVVG